MFTRTIRFLSVAGFVAALACSSTPRPQPLVALDGQMKDQTQTAKAQAAAPDVYAEAQRYYAQADKAFEDGDQKQTEYYADLATVTLATANERAKIADANAAVESAKARAQAAAGVKTEQDARLSDFSGRVSRMERIQQLQQQQQLSAADRAQLATELNKARATAAGLAPLAEQKALLEECSSIPGATARQDTRGVIVSLTDLFKGNKTQILPERLASLKAVADTARKYPGYPITVDGYTDSRGGSAANLTLSTARAQAVAQYLTDNEKLDFTRVKSAGHGGENPVADNSTADGRAKNRRVEVVFVVQ